MEKIDEFIGDSRGLIGKEATDVPAGWDVADFGTILNFDIGLAEKNPLYVDPGYATTTNYNMLLAPPTFLNAIRTPVSEGAFSMRDYGLANFITGVEFEWFDVIRLMDRFRSELKLRDVSERMGMKGKRAAVLASEANYWNRWELVGKGRGEAMMIPIDRGKEMLIDRDIYVYSDAEIDQIYKHLMSEAPARGSTPLYWEDVNIGDKLPALIKGPLDCEDLLAWFGAEGKTSLYRLQGELVYKDLKKRPGHIRTNPATNWPYWDTNQDFLDPWVSRLRGIPAPFAPNTLLVCLASMVATDWMSDEGFLRRLKIETPKVFMYGDTEWLSGEVVDKYKEKIGEEKYYAADIRIDVINQLKEKVASGAATVYLPSPGHPVVLPVPQ